STTISHFSFLIIPPPPRSTLFPYTTLFRSEFGIKDGLGCNIGHYLPAEMDGKIVPDEHIHEHATCFNVRDFGLVVISSCGHVGIDRKSTRLNSSHLVISYAVFCLKKKKK